MFESLIEKIARMLDEAGVRYMIIGEQAVLFYFSFDNIPAHLNRGVCLRILKIQPVFGIWQNGKRQMVLRRLQPSQKCSVIDVMKPTVPRCPGTR